MSGYLLLGQTCVRCIFCRLEAMMISALNSFTGNRFPNQIFKSCNTVNEWRHDGYVDIRPGNTGGGEGGKPHSTLSRPARVGFFIAAVSPARPVGLSPSLESTLGVPTFQWPSVVLSGQMQTQNPALFQRESAVPRIASVPVVPVRCGR